MALPTGMTVAELDKAAPGSMSVARRWWNANKDNKLAQAKLHVAAAGSGVRAGGEALFVGGALGAAHAISPTGLDIKSVPVDAAVGVLSILASVGMAHTEVGSDLRNAGSTALGVFAFRKTHDMVREAKIKKDGITPGGGAALPPALGAPIDKSKAHNTIIAGENQNYPGGTPGYQGLDVGAEDPVIRAARYL